ncbi:hypothetical protein SS37A_37040 (plasmid) [Methylocystis iwaonis]|uniref:Transposase n=1 Tax=Methylocystis iwaonis TaxID=2885079 RepID=A0ABM8EDT9_9HYPH|nr:hypothetical protein SS37A_37040 [Methylocystis iwaonis]
MLLWGDGYFSREFKVEAVRLVKERGVTVAQACPIWTCTRMCCGWIRELTADPAQAFSGHDQQKPEHLEIEKLRREVGIPSAGTA